MLIRMLPPSIVENIVNQTFFFQLQVAMYKEMHSSYMENVFDVT